MSRPLPSDHDLLVCPCCHGPLDFSGELVLCRNSDCRYSTLGFPWAGTQPVLVDFDNSVFERSAFSGGSGAQIPRQLAVRGFRPAFYRFIRGSNPVTPQKAAQMVGDMKALSSRPTLLVIGGGTIGSGAEVLYEDPAVRVIGTDVYASPNTCTVADGHALPFADGQFDGVWIQAVLEHVLEPKQVVSEIFRVLKPNGLIYSDTPFMQQVHEGPYDFTRYTQSGHRWLFRQFEQIDAGSVGGAGTVVTWALRYLVRAMGAPLKVCTLTGIVFFWFRFFDHLCKGRLNADGASGTYFYGRKSDRVLTVKEMVAYYQRQS